MGCTASTEARRDMLLADAGPRVTRSFSMPAIDRQRLRSRVSSVLGTLGLGRDSGVGGACKYTALSVEEIMKSENDYAKEAAAAAALPILEAPAKMAIRPRTPTLTPPNEPEVINAWELMAGLEDDAPPPPAWMQADMDFPVALEFDPEILSGFREALADKSPPPKTIACSLAAKEETVQQERKDAGACGTPISPATGDMPQLSGIVRARINAFQERIERRTTTSRGGRDAKVSSLRPPGGERKAVVYFTSLRGVRKTFVDCCAVRSILRSYGVSLDERDVSMHAAFKAELAELLAAGLAAATLPRVFVNGKYLGGAEDVLLLHEAGELARALDGCEAAPVRKLGYMEACAACGDVRFVPCETCYGSCKVFAEEDDGGGGGDFRRCPDCNENGLIRCPTCCC